MKDEVHKLDFSNLLNVPISLNNLKTKVVHLDVGKLKTVLVDLKKHLSDVLDNEVVKTKNSTHWKQKWMIGIKKFLMQLL